MSISRALSSARPALSRAAQVLALAYSRFKRRAHLEGAERICGYIEFLLKTSYQLPSVSSVAVGSQSSARTYAFAGGAFADMHAATGENKYIVLCRILFDELDGLFMSESGSRCALRLKRE